MKCKVCGGHMAKGLVMANTLWWATDFPGDSSTPTQGVTCSFTGTPVFTKGAKCAECGHSVVDLSLLNPSF